MDNRPPEGPGAEMIRELLEPQGYALVDFAAEQVRTRFHVRCVLYHRDGINLDSLGEVHRALQPRLEMLYENRDIHMEFSSPGLSRNLKSAHEFRIFRGRAVTVLLEGTEEWVSGTISDADETTCRLTMDDGNEESIPVKGIRKARLMDS